MRFFLFISLIHLLVIPALAQTSEKIETDRPDQTETPWITPRKWFQGEMGFQVEKGRDGLRTFLHPTLLSKFGLADKFELRLITDWVTEETLLIPDGKGFKTGLAPVRIGGKIGLLQEKGMIPKTSLIFHTSIPGWASPRFREVLLAPDFRFVMSHSLSDRFGLGYNLGAQWEGNSHTPQWLYTFAPSAKLGEKWSAYVEAFGFISKEKRPEHSLDGGLLFLASPDIQLDLAAAIGLSAAAPQHYITLGFSFRFH